MKPAKSITSIDQQHAAADAACLLAKLSSDDIRLWLKDRKNGRRIGVKRSWLPSCGVAIEPQPEYTELVRAELNLQRKALAEAKAEALAQQAAA